MYLHLHVWIDSILITHTSRAIRKEKALPGKTQASAGKFRGKDAEIVGLRASVDAKVQAAVKETFAQVAAALTQLRDPALTPRRRRAEFRAAARELLDSVSK